MDVVYQFSQQLKKMHGSGLPNSASAYYLCYLVFVWPIQATGL
jgi:hypothetical protein